MPRLCIGFGLNRLSDPVCLLLTALAAGGCHSPEPASGPTHPRYHFLTPALTVSGIGAGQGVTATPSTLYIYGDSNTGVVRTLHIERRGNGFELVPAARDIALTVGGHDLISHPTGLALPPASQPGLPTFLGDTVRQKGMIYTLDLRRAATEGNLDHAVLNRTQDDLATNGSRPCYVRLGNRWLIATSDYGPTGNQIRLYDPLLLATAARTSSPGLLVAGFPCPPFVQNLHWSDDQNTLTLVLNTTAGRGWRLTHIDLPATLRAGHCVVLATQDFEPTDELEGFCTLPNRATDASPQALFVTSSRTQNVHLAVIPTPATRPSR